MVPIVLTTPSHEALAILQRAAHCRAGLTAPSPFESIETESHQGEPTNMKTLFLVLLFSVAAHAYQDVTCWDGDCLQHGWTRLDPYQGTFTDFQCYRDGCRSSGWIVGGTQDIRYFSQCKTGGCFQQGWYEIDRDTQTVNANIVCNAGDCLTNGWKSYGSTLTLATTCTQNDCTTQGWTSQTATGYASVICKNAACFTEGWIESEP